MPRFFAEVDGQRALIRGADAQHISGPLRIRLGEDLPIRDGDKGYLARVIGVSRQQVELEILDEQVLADRGPRTVRLGGTFGKSPGSSSQPAPAETAPQPSAGDSI